MIDIASRLELFTDDYLIDRLDGAALRLHHPVPANVALQLDRPWEGRFCGCCTVMHDGEQYRLYYRSWPVGTEGDPKQVPSRCCMATSADGVEFARPRLGLHEFQGNADNNIVLVGEACHAFAPFLDARPGVPEAQRYKALGMLGEKAPWKLQAWASPDGVRWSLMREEPVLTRGAFDSHNVAFWSEHEGCYLCYGRTFAGAEDPTDLHGLRTISRYTSEDFLHWSGPQPMSFGGTPLEEMYTNATAPYPRAPHLYIALPKRFMRDRAALGEDEVEAFDLHRSQRQGLSDGVFMTSRGGAQYDRLFMEGFVRPGLDRGNWGPRSLMAAHGMVQTTPEELSLYYMEHYGQPSARLRRYSLRTDGFVSVQAPWRGGEMVTKPITFAGSRLVVNYATSAAGGLRVELQDAQGLPLPGYTLDEATEHYGDRIEQTVHWGGNADVSLFQGKPVRLRFALRDADLYSIRFT